MHMYVKLSIKTYGKDTGKTTATQILIFFNYSWVFLPFGDFLLKNWR